MLRIVFLLQKSLFDIRQSRRIKPLRQLADRLFPLGGHLQRKSLDLIRDIKRIFMLNVVLLMIKYLD